MRLPSKKAQCVIKALETLKEHYGDKFAQIFKSITADNGSEFANLSEIGVPATHTVHGKEGQMSGKMAWLGSLYRMANPYHKYQIEQ